MKDFDFDELDRAVSSALGGQSPSSDEPRTASPATARAQSVAPERSARAEAPLEVSEREVPEVPAREEVAPRTTASSRPRTGRFMDVVHPSTDMRQTTPLSEVTLASEVPEAPVEKTPTPSRQEVPMNDVRVLPRNEVELPLAAQQDTQAEESASEGEWEPPVDSPFLPDAKVEKRPLGASQPTGGMDAPAKGEEISIPEEPALPDLDALLEVDKTPAVPDEPQGAPDTPVEPALDIEAEAVPEFDAVEVPTEQTQVAPVSTPKSDVSEYVGPVEITPQYTAKPSPAQESGEIYDTESYHQPFAAPMKKKGGAFKILLIILLVLVLGGGVGAGIYFYVLPML